MCGLGIKSLTLPMHLSWSESEVGNSAQKWQPFKDIPPAAEFFLRGLAGLKLHSHGVKIAICRVKIDTGIRQLESGEKITCLSFGFFVGLLLRGILFCCRRLTECLPQSLTMVKCRANGLGLTPQIINSSTYSPSLEEIHRESIFPLSWWSVIGHISRICRL